MSMIQKQIIAGNANNNSSSILWIKSSNNNSYIVYGSSNIIVICEAETQKIIRTLRGHKANITGLHHIKNENEKEEDDNNNNEIHLLSISEDKTMRYWCITNALLLKCQVFDNISDYPILKIDAYTSLSNKEIIVVTVNTNMELFVQYLSHHSSENDNNNNNNNNIKALANTRIKLPAAQMANCIHLIETADDTLLILLGGLDSKIHVKAINLKELRSNNRSSNGNGNSDGEEVQGIIKVTNMGMLLSHQDWVTGLCSIKAPKKNDNENENEVFIASSSQDRKICIWRLTSNPISETETSCDLNQNIENLNIIDDDDDDDGEDEPEPDMSANGGKARKGKSSTSTSDASIGVIKVDRDFQERSQSRLKFRTDKMEHGFYLDALCLGHEDHITHVEWTIATTTTSTSTTTSTEEEVYQLQLFSTCMDRNMILWEPDRRTQVWAPVARMGDIGGTLGGTVGGNLLGFVGGCMCPNKTALVGIGLGGSMHLWQREDCSSYTTTMSSTSTSVIDRMNRWMPRPFIGAHFGKVVDVRWSTDGSLLYSASDDQTCRVHASVNSSKLGSLVANKENEENEKKDEGVWREVSRVSIHGYDLSSIAICPSERCHLYLGSAEKAIRILDASSEVLVGLQKLCNISHGLDSTQLETRIHRAFSPELGLTNKAMDQMSTAELDEFASRGVQEIDWSLPPLQGQLADYTLWPESSTLYGHVDDVTAVNVSHDGKWLVSASKARDISSARIILWNLESKAIQGYLQAHESTVVCLEFSPDDSLLASSGKDRSIAIFAKIEGNAENDTTYQLLVLVKGAHKRIVWGCSWLTSNILATGSRDGFVKLWEWKSDSNSNSDGENQVNLTNISSFKPFDGVAVTAVEGLEMKDTTLLAVGSDDGRIQTWKDNSNQEIELELVQYRQVNIDECHGGTVRKLRWRPNSAANNSSSSSSSSSELQLASASDDMSIRLWDIL